MSSRLKQAIKLTIPVMAGYVFLGSAFGILVQSHGFSIWIALFMSLFIYSGAMQFATLPLLLNPIALIQVFVLTVSISARHLFYGLSMLKPFETLGKKKSYMIFALTDESYSLLLNHTDDDQLMFSIEAINHFYWIVGTLLGYLFGNLIPFSVVGIEFSMTALFIVIFLDKLFEGQLESLMIGLFVSGLSLLIFGSQYFIIPSMVGIVIGLLLRRKS